MDHQGGAKVNAFDVQTTGKIRYRALIPGYFNLTSISNTPCPA